MRQELGGGLPTKEQIANYCKQTLASGKVIPELWSCSVT